MILCTRQTKNYSQANVSLVVHCNFVESLLDDMELIHPNLAIKSRSKHSTADSLKGSTLKKDLKKQVQPSSYSQDDKTDPSSKETRAIQQHGPSSAASLIDQILGKTKCGRVQD